jgi:hypothetical protein
VTSTTGVCYCFEEQGRFRSTYFLCLQGQNMLQKKFQQEADLLDT